MKRRSAGSSWAAATLSLALVAGMVETGLSAASTGRFDLFAIPLVGGVWLLAGLGASLVEVSLLRVAVGPGGEERLARSLRDAWTTSLAARSPAATALVPAFLAFLTLSILWARFVVSEAHHATWIAITIVAGQVGLALLTAFFWQALRRALDELPFVPSGRAVIVGTSALGLVALVIVSLRFREELVTVGAEALLLPTLVLLFSPLLAASRRFPFRVGFRGGAVLLIVGLLAVLVGDTSRVARAMVARSPWAIGALRAGLDLALDVDGDGSAGAPFGPDCAPFDSSVHPLAFDITGNGVDEDCDGSDDYVRRLGERRPPEPLTEVQPDLVLITVDALRADRLGIMGHPRPVSPELDAAATDALVFERAYSQDSGTAPSLWSMMTGKTPFQVELTNADRFPPRISDEEKLLAEMLSRGGYRTEAYLCGTIFRRGRWNLDRGFERYREVCGRRRNRQGPAVHDPAIEALGGRSADDPPLFLWVHFYDPHHPFFDHPDVDFGSERSDLYDEEVHYVQRFVAGVVREARAERHPRPTFVFMTADHGERHGEHGRGGHARTLYREVTHVPLLAWGPGIDAGRVSLPVGTSDLYPTLLDLAHLPTPPASTMVSLVGFLRGEPGDPSRVVYQENSWSRPRRHVKGLIRGRHHLIRDLTRRTSELYDLIDDPRESDDLYGSGLPEEPELDALMDAFIPTTRIPLPLR